MTFDTKNDVIIKIIDSILNDKEAMEKVTDGVKKLGRPDLITFTFPTDPPKRISISYDSFSEAMAVGIGGGGCTDDGREISAKEATARLLIGAFTYATVRNSVIQSIEDTE